jgi:hypothetical protein
MRARSREVDGSGPIGERMGILNVRGRAKRRWQVRLIGETFDIEEFTRLFMARPSVT